MTSSFKVSIPSNGSSLFQFQNCFALSILKTKSEVSIPSNGSSLFQFRKAIRPPTLPPSLLSQSPQTGQVYFNYSWDVERQISEAALSQSPQTGQVYFNKMRPDEFKELLSQCLNPLKRVKFISIMVSISVLSWSRKSQSPQTGQVYFNMNVNKASMILMTKVSIPSNGSSLFQ